MDCSFYSLPLVVELLRMNGKIIFLAVMCFFMAVVFAAMGIYFLSSRFLQKLNDASAEKSEQIIKKNRLRAKGSGYITVGLAALTLFLGILVLLFSAIAPYLAVSYMILLIIALIILIFLYR